MAFGIYWSGGISGTKIHIFTCKKLFTNITESYLTSKSSELILPYMEVMSLNMDLYKGSYFSGLLNANILFLFVMF